jgi:chaperonin cofactor prefoldin
MQNELKELKANTSSTTDKDFLALKTRIKTLEDTNKTLEKKVTTLESKIITTPK